MATKTCDACSCVGAAAAGENSPFFSRNKLTLIIASTVNFRLATDANDTQHGPRTGRGTYIKMSCKFCDIVAIIVFDYLSSIFEFPACTRARLPALVPFRPSDIGLLILCCTGTRSDTVLVFISHAQTLCETSQAKIRSLTKGIFIAHKGAEGASNEILEKCIFFFFYQNPS